MRLCCVIVNKQKDAIMRFILALALSFVATAAMAEFKQPTATSPTTLNAPTGVDVKGCTFKRSGPSQEQVCEPNAVAELLKDGAKVEPYQNAFSNGSGGGAN